MRKQWASAAFWIVLPVVIIGAIATHVSGLANGAETSSLAAADTCDYGCLTTLVDQYLKALVAHDPAQIPVIERRQIHREHDSAETGRRPVGHNQRARNLQTLLRRSAGRHGRDRGLHSRKWNARASAAPAEGGEPQNQRDRDAGSPQCAGRDSPREIRPSECRLVAAS